MRILLRDLSPGTAYALQLRSNSADSVSEWSRVFTLTTDSDTVAPAKPTGVAGTMAGTSFQLTWNAVTLSTDGSAASDLDHYEVLVSSPGSGFTANYVTKDTKFEFPLEMNTTLFGSPRATVVMSVRAVDKAGNNDGYTSTVSQTNAAPAAPTSLTGTNPGIDMLVFKWTGVTDLDLKQYRLYSGTTVGSQTTLMWSGTATSASLQSVDYSTDRYYKVVSVDVFGTESTSSNVVGPLKPNSSTAVDSTAPAVPTGLAITLTNATDGKTANAAVSWTAVADPDNDLAEYIVDYKPSAASDWQTVKLDYTKTSTRIDGLLPYVNYDFRIRAGDFSANLSNWSSTVVKTATANAAPSVPTGLSIVVGKDNIQLAWNENTEADMANNAGTYDVTVATNSGFTTGVLQYRTGNTTLAINGLATNTQYWARVRAVDSAGLVSAYATSVNATTGTYPATPLSDGNVPSNTPTVTVMGGIGYLLAFWTPIANADLVTYEVFMSTTSGFTIYDSTTKVGEIDGSSILIRKTAAAVDLVYGTTYYIKVRPRDRDGTGTASAQASGTPTKAATGDITSLSVTQLTAGAFSAGAITLAPGGSIVTNTGGVSLTDSGIIIPSGHLDANVLKANTSFITTLNIGSGGVIQSTGYTGGGTTGFQLSNAGLTIKGSGNTIDASVLKGGTVTGTTINVGAGGVLNIDSTAILKSNNYAAGSTGYQLSSTGLEVNDGTVDAKVLKTGSAVIGDLIIGQSANSVGSARSFDYVAGTTGWKIGKNLFEVNGGTIKAAALLLQDSQNIIPPEFASFEFAPAFYTGKVTLSANNTMSFQNTGAKYGTQVVRFTANSANSNFNYFGISSSDYNIPLEEGQTYILSGYVKSNVTTVTNFSIRIRTSDGLFPVVATIVPSTSWQRVQAQFTVPAGISSGVFMSRVDFAAATDYIELDGIQLERKIANLNAASPWTPPGITFVDGGIVRTGEIRSNTNVTVNGVTQPAWSINMSGGAQFGDASVRGGMIVGPTSTIELTTNGNFETTSITNYTEYTQNPTGNTMARTTTAGEVITGTGSLKVAGTSHATLITRHGFVTSFSQTIPENNPIVVTFKMKMISGGTSGGTVGTVEILDASNNIIAFEYMDFLEGSNDILPGVTKTFSKALTVPAGSTASKIRVYAIPYSGTYSITFDDLSITAVSDLGASSVRSGNYIANLAGWKITSAGFSEFNNILIRGGLQTAASGSRFEIGRTQAWLGDSNSIRGFTGRTDEDQPATISTDPLGRLVLVGATFGEENLSGDGVDSPASIYVGSDTPGGLGDPLMPGRGTGVSVYGRSHGIQGVATNPDTVPANQWDANVIIEAIAMKPTGTPGQYTNDGWARIGVTAGTAVDPISYHQTLIDIATETNNGTGDISVRSDNLLTLQGGLFYTVDPSEIIMDDTTITMNADNMVVEMFDGLAGVTGNVMNQKMWMTRAQGMPGAHGGGFITVDASFNISWSQRFIAIAMGRGASMATSGFFDITMPAVSTSVPGHGGAATQTVSANGILLGAWQALYYEIPFGSVSTSQDANFHVVSYTSDFTIPNDWIMVASRNSDQGMVYFINGHSMGPWIDLPLSGSWVDFDAAGTGHRQPQYRKVGANKVEVRGLMKHATTTTTGTFATLPAGFRPAETEMFNAIAAGGACRIDLLSTGVLTLNSYHASGNGGFVSLNNIEFTADA